MLPIFTERPLVLHAFPRRHQTGKSLFFPEGRAGVCPGVRAHDLPSGARDSQKREARTISCATTNPRLLYIANMAADPAPRLVVHAWRRWRRPDWCILEPLIRRMLPFTDVVTVAKAVKALCDRYRPAGRASRRSGSTGLHRADSVGAASALRAIAHPRGGCWRGSSRPSCPRSPTVHPPGPKAGGKGVPRFTSRTATADCCGTVQGARPLAGARPCPWPLKWEPR